MEDNPRTVRKSGRPRDRTFQRTGEIRKRQEGDSKMSKSKQVQKPWKVRTPIKVAIGLFRTMCLVIAIVGLLIYG